LSSKAFLSILAKPQLASDLISLVTVQFQARIILWNQIPLWTDQKRFGDI